MSDETTPQEEPESAPETTSAAKPRSPVEKVIVRGGIAVLLVVAGIQGFAAYGFQMSVSRIKAAINVANSGGDDLTLSKAEGMMAGFWSKSDGKRTYTNKPVVFAWRGLYQKYTLVLNVSIVTEDREDPVVFSYDLNTETSRHEEILAERSPKPSPAAGDKEAADDGDAPRDGDGNNDGGY